MRDKMEKVIYLSDSTIQSKQNKISHFSVDLPIFLKQVVLRVTFRAFRCRTSLVVKSKLMVTKGRQKIVKNIILKIKLTIIH